MHFHKSCSSCYWMFPIQQFDYLYIILDKKYHYCCIGHINIKAITFLEIPPSPFFFFFSLNCRTNFWLRKFVSPSICMTFCLMSGWYSSILTIYWTWFVHPLCILFLPLPLPFCQSLVFPRLPLFETALASMASVSSVPSHRHDTIASLSSHLRIIATLRHHSIDPNSDGAMAQ